MHGQVRNLFYDDAVEFDDWARPSDRINDAEFSFWDSTKKLRI